MSRMLKVFSSVLFLVLIFGCSSNKSASYYRTQKQIADGDIDFASKLRVDEYLNAFPLDDFAVPKTGENLSLSVDYFLTVAPKDTESMIAQVALRTRRANTGETSKNYGIALVLDVSGSMGWDSKLKDSKAAIQAMISELKTGSEFSLIIFSDNASVLIPPTVINNESRVQLITKVDGIKSDGGTNIEAGLIQGYQTLSKFSKSNFSRLLLLTDGNSTVGVRSPTELATKARVEHIAGARISTIGIGGDVDETLLRTIAEKSNGSYYFADNAKTLKKFLQNELQSMMIPAVKNISLHLVAEAGFKIKKVYGYQDVTNESSYTLPNLGELNVDDWRIFMVEFEGPKTAGLKKPLMATVEYESVSEPKKGKMKKVITQPLDWNSSKPSIHVNKIVARNAIILVDALTLIQTSKLVNDDKYKEANSILSIQLTNLNQASNWDKTGSIEKEIKTLSDVRAIVREKGKITSSETEVALNKESGPQNNPKASLLKSVFSLGQKIAPGPWSLILGLLGLAL